MSVTNHQLATLDEEVARSGARLVVAFATHDRAPDIEPLLDRRATPHFRLPDVFDGRLGTVFPQDGHWNERGHSIAAQALSGFLASRQLLGSRARPVTDRRAEAALQGARK
jgi:hypothetical protein